MLNVEEKEVSASAVKSIKPKFTLYGPSGNPRAQICRIIAEYEQIDLQISEINLRTKAGLDEHFFEKFPHSQGKIPALEGPGIAITETAAIAHYLASVKQNSHLLGKSKEETAQVLQWTLIFNSELLPALSEQIKILPPRSQPYNKAAVIDAEKKSTQLFTVLDSLLHARTFLVGQRITLADLFLANHLIYACSMILDQAWRAQYPNIFRHFQTVVHQPKVMAVLKVEPTLIENKLQYIPPTKDKASALAAANSDKKQAKKDDDEDERPLVPAEPKFKHPCEALGPAKCFPLDEWKRKYSNSRFPDAMKWLEENIDLTEYSFWKVTYKYNEELTEVFMSGNLIGGLHSRLEASRKYLFGSAGVYGNVNASKIQGAYLIRGSDFKSVFDVAPDWESYDFQPLDFKKDIDFIKGCWNWDNVFDGLEYADGKVFK